MSRGNDVVKNTKSMTFTGFKQPITSIMAVFSKLKQKIFIVTAVSNVPNMAGMKMTISAWHDALSLKQCSDP